ncbi:thiamine diphosphokinase [Pseudohalocynthiibacter aestuariivivens]|uniref:Thiamine diphosphokinase n=1 Tax=Pseudohalocynthiibacter aestuariivivens TaxID=1591409 RepID=A0ABV5JC38_9RHOB|nr:thiamine diphosphokinase [Pseudohalocynthiibacter aestuariivivens]MBS9718404.1 thiamine diphosphokinase [Pseudohalocynthiibacter aestuariivivens]
MKRHIIHDSGPITLIGGGAAADGALAAALAIAPNLVAADGGAQVALAAGHMPLAVIGDFDSISSETKAAIPAERLHQFAEQDTTDFEKCISRISVPLILGVGFNGARLDHELSALSVMARYPDQPCILIGGHDITFLAPTETELNLKPGSRVSLFPMGPVRGSSEGLRWAIDDIPFAPDGLVGTSNIVTGPVRLSFSAAKMLLILPRDALAECVKVFLSRAAPLPAL